MLPCASLLKKEPNWDLSRILITSLLQKKDYSSLKESAAGLSEELSDLRSHIEDMQSVVSILLYSHI